MLMYGGNGVQLLPRFQDNKFQALLNEHQNTIEDPIQEKTEMPGKIHPFNIYIRGCQRCNFELQSALNSLNLKAQIVEHVG